MLKQLLLVFLLTSPFLYAESEWDGNLNLSLGVKNLDSNDWDPIDDQGFLGVQFDIGKTSWPISLALQHIISAGSEEETTGGLTTESEGYTSELRLGVMKNIAISGEKNILSLGGGLALVEVELVSA